MSDEISVGDLVVVVRGNPCCGAFGKKMRPGAIFRVSEIVSMFGYKCIKCNTDFSPNEIGATSAYVGGPVYCLKKIPPLSEDESINESKELETTR